jgi:hypothetical protein
VNALSAQNTAVVTGAGSGVGRAVVCELAREGWRVALVGRRPEPLVETKALAGAGNPELLVWPCDIGDPTAVEQMGQGVMEAMGGVQLLVNAAGTNVPHRSLEILSLEDYQLIDQHELERRVLLRASLPAADAGPWSGDDHQRGVGRGQAGVAESGGGLRDEQIRTGGIDPEHQLGGAKTGEFGHVQFSREILTRRCWTSVPRHQTRQRGGECYGPMTLRNA